MNKEEFKKKWNGKDRENLSPSELKEFLCDSFEMYEKQGFAPLFHTPYTENESRIGERFKVLRRADTNDCDVECLPMWQIEFNDGQKIFAYPEEIFQDEQNWSYQQFLEVFKKMMLKKIDSYDGPKRIELKTAEKAVDWDDAYLIIGDGQPRLRDKRDQRLMEKDPAWAKETFNEEMEKYIEDFDVETVAEIVEKIFAK